MLQFQDDTSDVVATAIANMKMQLPQASLHPFHFNCIMVLTNLMF